MNIAEFKQANPDYAEVPDADLADALYRKYYAGMPRDEFMGKIGLAKESAKESAKEAAPVKVAAKEEEPANAPKPDRTLGVMADVPMQTPPDQAPASIDEGVGPVRSDFYRSAKQQLREKTIAQQDAITSDGGVVGKIAAKAKQENIARANSPIPVTADEAAAENRKAPEQAAYNTDQTQQSYRQRAEEYIRSILGVAASNESRDDKAAAQAFILSYAKREGISVDDMRQAIGGMRPELQQFSESMLDAGTLGLRRDQSMPAEGGMQEVAKGAGSLAGFLVGLPVKLAAPLVEAIGGRALEKTAADGFGTLLAKDIAGQSATLGLASGLEATGKALDTNDPARALGTVEDAAKGGAVLGGIFGTAGRVLPNPGVGQFAARAAGVNIAADVANSSNPFDDRSIQKKVFDYGLNTFFARHGANRLREIQPDPAARINPNPVDPAVSAILAAPDLDSALAAAKGSTVKAPESNPVVDRMLAIRPLETTLDNELKIGDRVQVTLNGTDLYKDGTTITGVSGDGKYAFVAGSQAGVPIDSLRKLDVAPRPDPSIRLKELDERASTLSVDETAERAALRTEVDHASTVAEANDALHTALDGLVPVEKDAAGNLALDGRPLVAVSKEALPEHPDAVGGQLSRQSATELDSLLALKGQKLVLFDEHPGLPDGFVSPNDPNTVFLSRTTTRAPEIVAGHEVTHIFEKTAPEAYQAYLDVLREEAQPGALDEARRQHGANVPDHLLWKEIGADIGGNAMADPKFAGRVVEKLQARLGEQAEPMVKKLIDAVGGALTRIRELVKGGFFNKTGEKTDIAQAYVKNLERVHNALADVYAEHFGQSHLDKALTPPTELKAKELVPPTGLKAPEALMPPTDLTTPLVPSKERTKREPPSILLEVAPDPNDVALTKRWNALPPEKKTEISGRVAAQTVPKVLKMIGVKGEMTPQLGGYKGETNPSFSIRLDRNATPDQILRVTKLAGHMLSQDSMMVTSNKKFPGAERAGLITVHLPKDASAQMVADIYKQIYEIDNGALQGHTTINGKMGLIDFSGRTRELAEQINTKLNNQFTVETDTRYAAFIDKKEYGYASDSSSAGQGAAAGSPVRDAAHLLRQEASRLLADELDRAEAGAKPGTGDGTKPELKSSPKRPYAGPGAPLVESTRDTVSRLLDDALLKAAPMAVGSDTARAIAKDFANAERKARWQWTQFDEALTKNFTAAERKAMWEAADAENDIRGQLAANPTMTRPAGVGLDSLPPQQRQVVETLHRYGEDLLDRARQVGMFDGTGVPYWAPRMAVMLDGHGEVARFPGGKQASSGGEGRNLTTSSPNLKGRKYLTAADTEAAASALAQARGGQGAELVRDVRTMPMAMARLERAIAGRELMNQIKQVGNATGNAITSSTGGPGFFTMDHPAFYTVKPRFEEQNGKVVPVLDANGDIVFDRVPIFISKDFEGPLKSVLSQPSGAIYNGLMELKGKAMGLIMYSPLIHNAVEWGRAMPVAPGKVLTFKIYFDGNKVKNDPVRMSEAIENGMVPIGHRGGMQDITGLAEQPDILPGRSWTAKLIGGALDYVSPGAGTAVKRGIDAAGDFWHNTLLWDRVGDLQAGLYAHVKDHLVADGVDPKAAGLMAAHFANRYAGAIPNEAMSVNARKVANILLFSRSFTLGNLGVMKDMITGLPKDVQAQVRLATGELGLQAAKSIARRKAVGAFLTDVALMYAANALLQSGLEALREDKTIGEVGRGYADRLHRLAERAREHPLDVLNAPLDAAESLLPNSENDRGRTNRIDMGADDSGTHIYLRLPTGKVGEEFIEWPTHPVEMLNKKLSTFARPVLQTITNDRGLGRQVYDPEAKGMSGMAKNVGKVVGNLFAQQFPVDALEGAQAWMAGVATPVDKAKVIGPLVGVTVSKGAPGGPAVGEMYAQQRKHQSDIVNTLPEVKKLLKYGKRDEAIDLMDSISMTASEKRRVLIREENPASRLSKQGMRRFNQTATDEEKERMARALDR